MKGNIIDKETKFNIKEIEKIDEESLSEITYLRIKTVISKSLVAIIGPIALYDVAGTINSIVTNNSKIYAYLLAGLVNSIFTIYWGKKYINNVNRFYNFVDEEYKRLYEKI